MKLSRNAKNAFMLGTLCAVSYYAVYIARNILSLVTTDIESSGALTLVEIGTMSSFFLGAYACGQLINGMIGEMIKAKYMICGGLLASGITNFIIPFITASPMAVNLVYAVTGFSLAMIYAPMTKLVSENTEPIHATRCSIGYTFASFLATPTAGILALFLVWQGVFMASGTILAVMAVVAFVFFTLFERRGIVKYGQYGKEEGEGSVKSLIKRGIVRFALISVITGVVRTSVMFWLPTYIEKYLSYNEQESKGITTVATFIIAFMSIIAIAVYELLGRRRDVTMSLMFALSVVFFALTYFVYAPILNIIFITLAIMTSNGAAAILYSVYCPSLRDTGMVSTATGFLDFVSYMAAAVANVLFANAVSGIGWGNLILIWMGIVFLGLLCAIPYSEIKKRLNNKVAED